MLGLLITASKGESNLLAERCIHCVGVIMSCNCFQVLRKTILPTWCPATVWWKTKLVGRMLRAVKIPAYIPSSTQRAYRRSDLAWCCCWNQKTYLLVISVYVVLIPAKFTGMVDNGNTCQLFHASRIPYHTVNTLAGMGRVWFGVNATSTDFLLYCHSLPMPSIFLLCFHQVLMIFLPTPYPFMFLFCSGSCFASNWDVVAGRPQGREVWVLPAQCEHTCTCLQVFWPKGKVLKSRCYQFYKGVLFWVVTVGYCLSRSSTKCDIMHNYVRSCYLLPRMSLFPNQQGQTGLLLPVVAFWCCWSVCHVPCFICFTDVALMLHSDNFPCSPTHLQKRCTQPGRWNHSAHLMVLSIQLQAYLNASSLSSMWSWCMFNKELQVQAAAVLGPGMHPLASHSSSRSSGPAQSLPCCCCSLSGTGSF